MGTALQKCLYYQAFSAFSGYLIAKMISAGNALKHEIDKGQGTAMPFGQYSM